MSIDASANLQSPQPTSGQRPGLSRPNWDYAENSTLTTAQTMSFWDFLDIINPLHHLPFIGPIYREVSGDELSGTARVLGGTLYGGPVGLATGVADAVIQQETGRYMGNHVMTAMLGDGAVQADPGMSPGGDTAPQLALGPGVAELPGREGLDDGHSAAPPVSTAVAQGALALAPAPQSGATVIVQRDGTIIHLGDAPPAPEPMRGARHYEVAARLDR